VHFVCRSVITEHRNMLLEDAVSMIARSFANYRRCRQTKQPSSSVVRSASVAESPSLLPPSGQCSSITTPSLSTVAERLQPDKATRRLIGLLSADCELTYNELDQIISYLQFRQKVLVSTKGLSLNSVHDTGPATSTQHDTVRKSPGTTTTTTSVDNVPAEIQFVNSLLLAAAKLANRQ